VAAHSTDQISLTWIARAAVHGSASPSLTPGDWERLPYDAEAAHLAPLLDAWLSEHDHDAPDQVVRQLKALRLRHLAWHRARTRALLDVLDAFERLSIEAIVLKGAALAWTIYPSPYLRSMSDLDLLVPAAAAGTAQAALRNLGFSGERAFRTFGRHAHHHPIASRVDAGFAINVEVHVDALSRDTRASIALNDLSEPPRRFLLDGTPRRALGHIDMLRHLTHHLLEPTPSSDIRLIGVIDLLRFARTFHEAIDWPRLETEFPFVVTALGCLHHVVPLPDELRRFIPSTNCGVPRHVGKTMRPLRWIVRRERRIADVAAELLRPPDWWMHAYYNVPMGHSLKKTQLVRHPWRVAQWLCLRMAGW